VRNLPSATVHEAYGRRGALPAALQALEGSMRLHGQAYPVAAVVGDNLWVHRALDAARRGDVLVVATIPSDPRDDESDGSTREREYGYWGELMTTAALRRGLGGLVIDGWVRDRDAIVESGFPVFSRGVSIRGTTKDPGALGTHGRPIEIGGVSVAAGDLVVGDGDGVVVVATGDVASVLGRAEQRVEAERDLLERIRAGESLLRALGLEGT
jgi:4-hydroxy-4-methyl-2-oxoglutarate aldolase